MKCDPTVALRADVTYISPTGRRCRWVPSSGEHRQVTAFAVFQYLDVGDRCRHSEAARWFEGFHLTPANYQLLKEAPHAAAR